MSNFIVETKSGNFLLVAGATSSHEAIKTALARAVEFGIPVAARLTSLDPLEPEPPLSMYLTVRR
jgi:ABC-type sugar transport system substrate-binding protein